MSDVAKKLHVKPGSRVLALARPKDVALPLPPGATIVTAGKGQFDVVLAFVRDGKALRKAVKPAFAAAGLDGVLWFCYPKQTSGIATDLNRDVTWRALQPFELHGCAACAIDDRWSALRVRHSSRTTPRTTSGRPVRTATAKPVKPPADLMRAIAKSPTSKATWALLAPSHVKEYVRWVIEAKQAETRERRIAKTVEMLAAGQRDRNAKYRPSGPAPDGQRGRRAARMDR